MAKDIKYGDEVKEALKAGINKVADAVGTTLGPKGRNVLINKGWGTPDVTKDGYTVAKEIQLLDPIEDTAAQLVKQTAMKTNELAGDGTSSSCVLAQAIVNLGFEVLNDNCNATLLKSGIDKAILEVNDYLSTIKTDISLDNKELVEYIATISANDPAAGKIVAEAYQSVGEGGVVVLEKDKNSVETVIKKFDGFEIDRGYLSPWFATKDEVCELENPYVLLWDKRLSNMTDTQELMALLEKIVANKASLVLVSEDVEGDALATMVLNKTRGVISCVAVKSPGFGDRSQNLMSDLAVFLGCTDFSKKPGAKLDKIQISELGKCSRIIVTKATTTFIGGGGNKEDIDSRISLLKKEYLESESNYDKDKINERVGKLTSSIAVIKLGAHTEAEMKEKHYRFEDAVSATRAALTYGIVPGGGMALLFASKNISESYPDPDEDKGLQVVKEALASPFNKILTNAGKDPHTILKNLKDTPYYGYDVKNDKYGDMLKDLGVIDPVYVTQSAMANAGAIGGIFLTTEAIIVNSPEQK
jgi:chaperonin GroEL